MGSMPEVKVAKEDSDAIVGWVGWCWVGWFGLIWFDLILFGRGNTFRAMLCCYILYYCKSCLYILRCMRTPRAFCMQPSTNKDTTRYSPQAPRTAIQNNKFHYEIDKDAIVIVTATQQWAE